ncbi:hypothetical protein P9112_000230 [Eukaryota sp. TZLM1-RC]
MSKADTSKSEQRSLAIRELVEELKNTTDKRIRKRISKFLEKDELGNCKVRQVIPWGLRQCKTFWNRDTNSALNIHLLAEDILARRERSEVFKRQQSQNNVIEPTDESQRDVDKDCEGDGTPMSPIQQPKLNTLSRAANGKFEKQCIVSK